MKGDVNIDGRKTLEDMLLILMHINGDIVLSGESLTNADIDGDGSITIGDAIKIRNHIQGFEIIDKEEE